MPAPHLRPARLDAEAPLARLDRATWPPPHAVTPRPPHNRDAHGAPPTYSDRHARAAHTPRTPRRRGAARPARPGHLVPAARRHAPARAAPPALLLRAERTGGPPRRRVRGPRRRLRTARL